MSCLVKLSGIDQSVAVLMMHHGSDCSAVTPVGAKRGVKALPGVEEDVGMIGLHWGGTFLELVPWNGHVNWQVRHTQAALRAQLGHGPGRHVVSSAASPLVVPQAGSI